MGNLKFVRGRPAAPQLLTLNVNLNGLIYSEWHSSTSCHGSTHYLLATHLGMYYMKRYSSPSAWKSLVMIGSMGGGENPFNFCRRRT